MAIRVGIVGTGGISRASVAALNAGKYFVKNQGRQHLWLQPRWCMLRKRNEQPIWQI